MKQKRKEDRLWNGLPTVFHKGNYIIFSPYAKKVAYLNEKQLSDQEIHKELTELGFFGVPLKRKEDRLSVTLYLTQRCNLQCIYCFDDKECGSCDSSVRESDMTPEFAINSLEQIDYKILSTICKR